MLKKLVAALTIVLAVPQMAMPGDDPRIVKWDDLVPPAEIIENPFEKLDADVINRLRHVVRAREDLKMGFLTEDSDEWKEALSVERDLLQDGVDVEGLLLARDRIMAEAMRRNSATNAELNGQFVRMPGYALPLEQSEAGVTEFLLVPYVGACIHTPPPPANQIVYVKLARPYRVKSLYEPVWITGTMATESSSRNLSLVDGVAPVETGYRIEGIGVEPYGD